MEAIMTGMLDFDLSPQITIGEAEHRKLAVLALTSNEHSPDDNDFLLWELDRARLVPDDQLPGDVVRLGSVVRYRDPRGEHTVRLGYPAEHAPYPPAVSVLTPVGTALLGLRKGQSITWMVPTGERRFLTVLDVVNLVEERR